MAIRTMLVPLGGVEDDDTLLDTVFSIAKRLGAHVDAMYVSLDPRDAVAFVGEGMTAAMIEQIMQAAERDGASKGSKSAEMFKRVVASHNAEIMETPRTAGFSARLLRLTGREDEKVAERGRLADLIVAPLPGSPPRGAPSFTLDACLRETGRPVLVMPTPVNYPFGNHIAIAWNGSVEAGRALRFAMPFLEGAYKVTVLSVFLGSTLSPTGEDVVDYLAWCGVKARSVLVPSDPSGSGAGKALMAAAAGEGADMLVMGAYTRNQLRRMIFGGVTGEVLGNVTIPVLMVH